MFEIRRATLQDCRGIAKVQVDSYRAAYAGLFPQPYLDHFTYDEEEQDWVKLLQSNTSDILVVAATSDGTITGYTLARAQPNIYPGYDSEIVALHVRQTAQRNGVGKALLRGALRDLSERHCQSVMLWTLKGNPTRLWYEHLQGTVLGEKHYQVNDWDIVEIAYGWEPLSALYAKIASS